MRIVNTTSEGSDSPGFSELAEDRADQRRWVDQRGLLNNNSRGLVPKVVVRKLTYERVMLWFVYITRTEVYKQSFGTLLPSNGCIIAYLNLQVSSFNSYSHRFTRLEDGSYAE